MSRRSIVAKITGGGIVVATLLWLLPSLWLLAVAERRAGPAKDVSPLVVAAIAAALAAATSGVVATGLYRGRYGVVAATAGALLATTFGSFTLITVLLAGLGSPFGSQEFEVLMFTAGGSALAGLGCWVLSSVLGYLDFARDDHAEDERLWALLTGPLFPGVVMFGAVIGPILLDTPYAALVGLAPFGLVGLARHSAAVTADGVGVDT